MPFGKYYPYILEGADMKLNEEKHSLYRLLIAIGKIHTRYIERNYLHKYPQILTVALEEMGILF